MNQKERVTTDKLRQRTSLNLCSVKPADVVVITTDSGIFSFKIHTPAKEDRVRPNFAVGVLRGPNLKDLHGSPEMGAIFVGVETHDGRINDGDVIIRGMGALFEFPNGESVLTGKVKKLSVNKQ